jgi:uncharacterized protein (TIGR02118 family)
MIKRLTMWHAKDDVSNEEALNHWLNQHAELVRRVPGIRRYVQDHCVDSPESLAIPYTGLGEVWFDSFESAASATKTPEWAAVIADADKFMNLTTVVAAWAEEHEIIPLA